MKRDDIVAINCTVGADGTVIPSPGYGGPATSDGPFHGNCHFTRYPARKGEKEMIVCNLVCNRLDDSAESVPLIGVDYRDIVYFFLEVERLNGYFNCQSYFKPTVGGAYPSCLNMTDYPSGLFPSVDPSTVVTDGSYGWPVPDSTLAPYYLTNGASIWVEGDVGLGPTQGSPGYVDLPDREVLAVGGMRTLSQTIGPDYYEWDVCAITVREYKYVTFTWAEWWAII